MSGLVNPKRGVNDCKRALFFGPVENISRRWGVLDCQHGPDLIALELVEEHRDGERRACYYFDLEALKQLVAFAEHDVVPETPTKQKRSKGKVDEGAGQ